jgi:hypothetical protein
LSATNLSLSTSNLSVAPSFLLLTGSVVEVARPSSRVSRALSQGRGRGKTPHF